MDPWVGPEAVGLVWDGDDIGDQGTAAQLPSSSSCLPLAVNTVSLGRALEGCPSWKP